MSTLTEHYSNVIKALSGGEFDQEDANRNIQLVIAHALVDIAEALKPTITVFNERGQEVVHASASTGSEVDEETDRNARAYGWEIGRGTPMQQTIYYNEENPFLAKDWRERVSRDSDAPENAPHSASDPLRLSPNSRKGPSPHPDAHTALVG